MDKLVPITEATARLSELVHDVEQGEDVLLVRHGRPAAMLVAPDRYDALLEEIEDLRDRLLVHEAEGLAVPLKDVRVELGLLDYPGGVRGRPGRVPWRLGGGFGINLQSVQRSIS